jgi:hypothetical protein
MLRAFTQEQSRMDEKERLIEELNKSRQLFYSVVDTINKIDRDMIIYPPWTIKHVLAHLTGWDDATTSSLRAHASGQDQVTPAAEGIDFYNAHSVSTREGLDYDHTYREWQLAREELKDAIRNIPPEKFDQKLIYPWGHSGTVSKLVAIMYDHEAEHAEEIERLMKQPEKYTEGK